MLFRSALIATVTVWLIAIILKTILKKETMGDGDYFVIFSLTLILGIEKLLWIFIIAGFAGIIAAIVLKKKQLPFLPLLFLGSLVVLLF